MKKILFCLTALLTFASFGLVGNADSAVTEIYWEPITTYVDGSPIEKPVYYRVYCDVDTPGVGPFDAGTNTYVKIADVLAGKPDGKHICTLTSHLNSPCETATDGVCESNHSPEVTIWKNTTTYYSDREPSVGVLKMR